MDVSGVSAEDLTSLFKIKDSNSVQAAFTGVLLHRLFFIRVNSQYSRLVVDSVQHRTLRSVHISLELWPP